MNSFHLCVGCCIILFARLLIEKKDIFSSQLDLLYVRLYYVIVYDIIKFQIDLVNLASSKNFVNRLHNLVVLFFK